MHNCTAIIVNYNTGGLLKTVVNSALDCEEICQIILIDNLSTDNSMSLIEDNDKIEKIFLDDNYGFASSCNLGANKANSKYLLFLNPDCIIKKSTIVQLLTTLRTHKNSAIIGCNITNPDGTEQRASRRRLPTLWRAFLTYSHLESLAQYCQCFTGVNLNHLKMPLSIQKVEAISGALILMKADIFNNIDGFDVGFTLHFEDLDLFKRTIDSGYDILFDPNIRVIHHQGTSSQSNPNIDMLKKQGIKRYFKKHGSMFSRILLKLI